LGWFWSDFSDEIRDRWGCWRGRGSGPRTWVWSWDVGLVLGRGSGPRTWVWSRDVGLVPGRGSGPGTWVWSRDVGGKLWLGSVGASPAQDPPRGQARSRAARCGVPSDACRAPALASSRGWHRCHCLRAAVPVPTERPSPSHAVPAGRLGRGAGAADAGSPARPTVPGYNGQRCPETEDPWLQRCHRQAQVNII